MAFTFTHAIAAIKFRGCQHFYYKCKLSVFHTTYLQAAVFRTADLNHKFSLLTVGPAGKEARP